MTTSDRRDAVFQLVYLAGVFAVVILQDPGLRAEVVTLLRRARARVVPEPETVPAPADVSAMLRTAEEITRTAPPTKRED